MHIYETELNFFLVEPIKNVELLKTDENRRQETKEKTEKVLVAVD